MRLLLWWWWRQQQQLSATCILLRQFEPVRAYPVHPQRSTECRTGSAAAAGWKAADEGTLDVATRKRSWSVASSKAGKLMLRGWVDESSSLYPPGKVGAVVQYAQQLSFLVLGKEMRSSSLAWANAPPLSEVCNTPPPPLSRTFPALSEVRSVPPPPLSRTFLRCSKVRSVHPPLLSHTF